MFRSRRSKTASITGSESGTSSLPPSLRGLPAPRKEKIPVISLFLESSRNNKTREGAKLLKEAKTMLDEIKDKLDPITRRHFEAQIEEYVYFYVGMGIV
jgi:hypothetical protein